MAPIQNKTTPKVSARSYSRYSQVAINLLGRLIRAARKERKMTAQDLATCAGLSRRLASLYQSRFGKRQGLRMMTSDSADKEAYV